MVKPREKRADRWIRELYPFLTGRQIDESIESRMVQRKDGARVAKGDRFAEVDALDLSRLDRHLEAIRAGNPKAAVRVVEEHTEFVLLDKSAGVACHPLRLFDSGTVTHWCWANYPEIASSFPSPLSPLTPHRLDAGTSGLLILARNPDAYAKWRQRFSSHRLTKTYLAWCWGNPDRPNYSNDTALAHDPADDRRIVDHASGRPPVMEAHTRIRVRKYVSGAGLCLMEAVCTTGATHQVRVHLSQLGFPLVGDELYDPQWSTRAYRPRFHWLRAVGIEGEGLSLAVGYRSFVRKLPRIIAMSGAPSKEESQARS